MMFYDEELEYLEDPIRLFDTAIDFDEEYDIKDIITIEDEGVADLSNRFDQAAFDIYIKSYIKDTNILPNSFREIKRNVELLDNCKPLSIEIVDCHTFPWYNQETSKIFYNEDLEKHIKAHPNENIDKFKEIMPNQYDDEGIDVNILNSNISKDDQLDKDYSIDIKGTTKLTDEAVKTVDKESKFQSYNKNDNSSHILQPCERINCLSLFNENGDKKTRGTNKVIPHYHAVKADKCYNNNDCKNLFDEENKRKKYNAHKNIKSVNHIINTKATFIQAGDKKIPQFKQNNYLYDQTLNKPHNNNIIELSCNKLYDHNKVVTETSNKSKETKICNKKVDNYSKSNATADQNWEKQFKNFNECLEETRKKFFNNSTFRLNNPNYHKPKSTRFKKPQDQLLQRVDTYSTEVSISNHLYNNNNNLSLMQSHGGIVQNIRPLENNNSYPYNNLLYTPYVSPITYYPNLYVTNSEPSVTRNYLSTRFNTCNEVKRGIYNSLCNTQQSIITNDTPLIGINETVPLVVNNEIPKIGGTNTSSINQSKLTNRDCSQKDTNISKILNNVQVQENCIINNNNSIANNQLVSSSSITETNNLKQQNLTLGLNTNEIGTLKVTCEAPSTLINNSIVSNNNNNNKSNITISSNGKANVLNVMPTKNYIPPRPKIIQQLTTMSDNSQPASQQDMNVLSNNIKLKQNSKEGEIKEKKKKTTKSTGKNLKRSLDAIGAEKEDEKADSLIPDKKKAVNPNVKNVTQTGYSPPILPIPTYKKTFEILEHLNITSKFKRRVDLDIEKAIHDLYKQEKILSNRRFTLDLQTLSPNKDKSENH